MYTNGEWSKNALWLLFFLLFTGIGSAQTWFARVIDDNCLSDDLRPMSVGVYDLVTNRTIMAYMGREGDPFIAVCDHNNNNSWSNPLQVGDDPVQDPHNYPQIVQTYDGSVHVFYGAHNNSLRYAYTPIPNDLNHWEDKVLDIDAVSYPMPFVDNEGEIYIFYRKTLKACIDYSCDYDPYPFRPMYYVKSADDGKTWSQPVLAIERWDMDDHMNEIYVGKIMQQGKSDKWHIGWTLAGGDKHDVNHMDLYHAVFNTKDDQFYSASGSPIGKSIDQTKMEQHCLVLDTGEPDGRETGYINCVVPNPTGDMLIFNNSYIWKGDGWEQANFDSELGPVEEWRNGYFYNYSGTLRVHRSRNGANWDEESDIDYPDVNTSCNHINVPVTSPSHSAACVFSKEQSRDRPDCIVTAAGYVSSGKPVKIILKADVTDLKHKNICKISAFICDEGNARVTNQERSVDFTVTGQQEGIIGNEIIDTHVGVATAYFMADSVDREVIIKASGTGLSADSLRICICMDGRLTEYKLSNIETGIDQSNLQLMQVAPNPFREAVHLSFYLEKPGPVKIQIVNANGQLARTISQGTLPKGEQHFDIHRDQLQKGVYYLVIDNAGSFKTEKLVLW